MHVPPGQWFINKEETFWKNTTLDRFLKLCTKYQDKILVLMAAHVHAGDVRAPYSYKNKELFNFTIMMTPGLSPIYGNNPGYTFLQIDEGNKTKPWNIDSEWRFFQLHEYMMFKLKSFVTFDPQDLYGFQLTNAESVRNYTLRIKDDYHEY